MELSIRDEDIINKICKLIKYNYKISKRKRITNFGEIETITLAVHDINFRYLLSDWGVPSGKKSETISPPLHKKELSINDYIRGLYDGDGSLGYTKQNFPYVSLTTKSEMIKDFIIKFICEITGKPLKLPQKNKRDSIYNICIFKEDAVSFCNYIYPENCLSINRKYENAQKIKKWIRPLAMKKRDGVKKWTEDQDAFILSNSIDDSCEKLDRSEQSIEMRLWRLSKKAAL